MSHNNDLERANKWPKLEQLPLPAKALVTATILVMGIAMAGAMGQIVIHDIIPTLFSGKDGGGHGLVSQGNHSVAQVSNSTESSTGGRGDLFGQKVVETEPVDERPFYKTEQFTWTLKWTHIHLFGINMIFIFMGGVALFLNLSVKARTWIVVTPFIGVLIDISAVWLKGYVSPVFFWLHIPGGTLFGAIFAFVSIRAIYEMWFHKNTGQK
jgi:hypothetical protein